MTALTTVIGRGATGAQPAANTVPVGSLYYDTTLEKWERSTGAAWEDCEPGGYAQGARVYNNANISVNNNSVTILTFNSERYDTNTIHDTGSNTSRLTCKTAGKYLITFTGVWAANATGIRYADIYFNNTAVIASCRQNATSAGDHDFTISTIYDLAVNEYVELRVYQNSGNALNMQVLANNSPEFMMQKIG